MNLGTGRAFATLVGICVAVSTMLGCQNKLAEENRDLHQQNRELQAKLDESHRTAEKPAPPSPAPVVVAPKPTPPQPLPPAPRPDPLPPATTPVVTDLGPLEKFEDVAAGTTTVTLPGDVFFDPGKEVIKETAKPSLDKVVVALKKEYAGKQIRVDGYTDADPIKHSHWKSNQELSEARAKAVRDYLSAKGIDTTRITIRGLGEVKPKPTKAQSRRVEVVVVTR